MSRDVLITGIPRSGTTLAAALVDALPDAVALNEPLWQAEWPSQHPGSTALEYAAWLREDHGRIRADLRVGVPVPERRGRDGEAVTNYYRAGGKTGETFRIVPFTRAGLSAEFLLAVKHNAAYLAALPALVESGGFTVIALLRHPLGVLSSWRSVPMLPVHRGELPAAMAYWPEMRALAGVTDVLERQLRMYELMCARLYEWRGRIHVLRYEELMVDRAPLYAALGRPVPGRETVAVKPRELAFYGKDVEYLRGRIGAVAEYARYFYPDL